MSKCLTYYIFIISYFHLLISFRLSLIIELFLNESEKTNEQKV